MKDTRRAFLEKTGTVALFASSVTLINAEEAEASGEKPIISVPMLMGPTTSEISVCWAISNPQANTKGWVEYGYDKDNLDQKKYAAPHGYAQYGRIKNVRLKGLDGKKRLYYRCCLKAENDKHAGWTSEVYHYDSITRPDKKVKFAVMNDTHLNHGVIKKCIERSKAFGSDFISWNGDLFNYVTKEQDLIDQIFMSYPGGMAQETPLVVPRGNHDCRGAAANLFGQAIGRPSSDEFYYHYRVGDVAFIVLDSTEDKEDFRLRPDAAFDQILRDQVIYLESLIRDPLIKQAKKKVVLTHIPLWRTKDWGRPYMRDLWLEGLEKNQVDLIISGHTHVYEFIPKNTPKAKLTDPVRDPHPPSNSIPQLIGGGPSDSRATVILGAYDQGKLMIQMEDMSGKILVKFSV
ncbi:MAG: metallophosphoesterase [Verrucomicrobia bacterium]|nr:metallophosphoesterase [Verrucomicrobiota bacterium]